MIRMIEDFISQTCAHVLAHLTVLLLERLCVAATCDMYLAA